MTTRRSFLKGLGASLLVPTPGLWTPEERQLVATDTFGPDTPGPSPPRSRVGYLFGVFPTSNWRRPPPSGISEEGWTAFYVEPTSTIFGVEPIGWEHWTAGRGIPSVYHYKIEFDVYTDDPAGHLAQSHAATPGEAVRAVTTRRGTR